MNKSLIISAGQAEHEATKVAVRAIVHHVGPHYFERVVNTVRREMAKSGVFNWQPSIDNMLFETCPAPDPWRGQWCYKLRCVHDLGNGEILVNEFYLPESQIDLAKADKLTELS